MKKFNFVFRNPMANVNHILATDIPYITVSDIHPNDHNIAQDICDFASGINDCAYIINERTRWRLLSEFGESKYLEKIQIDDSVYFIVTIHYEKLPVIMPDGSKKHRQAWDSPLRQIKELNIPSFKP